jgi:flagellar biosynthesis protein
LARDDQNSATPAPKRQIAVALSYDPAGLAEAPKVVASGRGKTAEHILALAYAKGIKVREDADLAEVLAAVEVDSVIPLSAFMAVAEILAYVYRANGQTVPEPLRAAP